MPAKAISIIAIIRCQQGIIGTKGEAVTAVKREARESTLLRNGVGGRLSSGGRWGGGSGFTNFGGRSGWKRGVLRCWGARSRWMLPPRKKSRPRPKSTAMTAETTDRKLI